MLNSLYIYSSNQYIMILAQVGDFSNAEVQILNNHIRTRYLDKNEVISTKGSVSTSLFYIVKDSV